MRCFTLFVQLAVFSSVAMITSNALDNEELSGTESTVYYLSSAHHVGDNIVQRIKSTGSLQQTADQRSVRYNCYGFLDHIWYFICYCVHHIWVIFFKPWVPYSHLVGREEFEQVSNDTTYSVDGRSFIIWNYLKNPKMATNL